MKKRPESLQNLVDEISTVLGDTEKTTELFYLLKQQGKLSQEKHLELLNLEKELVETNRITKDSLFKLVAFAEKFKVSLPTTFDVRVINSKDFPKEVTISNLSDLPSLSESIDLKQPSWLPTFLQLLNKTITQPLEKTIQRQLQEVTITGPRDPKKAIAVRLSNGKEFYTAIMQVVGGSGGSGSSVDLSTVESLLQQIENNTDDLEIKAETINLNTDTLEAKLQSLIDFAQRDREQILADAGKMFIVAGNVANIASAAETDFFLLKNPTGSNKNLKIASITGSLQNTSGKTAFRIYKNPTITTNGTALTTTNMKFGSTASLMQAFTAPTISVRGMLMDLRTTSDVAEFLYKLKLILSPGDSILITVDGTGVGLDHSLGIVFAEE